MHFNRHKPNPDALILFVDMNCFFASCEQQENPVLRGKPIAVCGSNANGVIIAPSKEAKTYGVKTGMRFNEARVLCPVLIAVEPRSATYRKYHIEMMKVLKQYAEHVIPKSIDEAMMNLTDYRLVYPDAMKLGRQIKQDIRDKAGEWLTCSIGIAPNTFLAKLASNLQKPDGLVEINASNVDEVLAKLTLTDLPGIGERNALRLTKAGIKTPLQMRQSSPEILKKVMGGIVGYYWYYRLHFSEVDFYSNGYRSMSAMRTLSTAQKNDPQILLDILLSLCMRLESRLVKHSTFCRFIGFNCRFNNRSKWETHVRLEHPLQDGTDMYAHLLHAVSTAEKKEKYKILGPALVNMGIVLHDFVQDTHVQYELFDNNVKRDQLRKTVYGIKDAFGQSKIIKAVELREKEVVQDIIGFGSVKDMYGY